MSSTGNDDETAMNDPEREGVDDDDAVDDELEDSMILLDDNENPIASATLLLDVSGDSSTDDALQILQSKTLLRKNLDRLQFQQHTSTKSTSRRTSSSAAAAAATTKTIITVSRRSSSAVGTAATTATALSVRARTSTSSNLQKNQLRPHSSRSSSTVPEKIAHYESETQKNVRAAAAATMIASSSSLTTTHAHSRHDSSAPPPPRFQVVLRVRPSTDNNKDTDTIEIVSDTVVRTHPPPTSYAGVLDEYTFDQVLAPSLSQQHVYEKTAAPLLKRVVEDNSSALLFCFGVTNSGKTYTVHGNVAGSSSNDAAMSTPQESWGILPRVLHDLYNRIQQAPQPTSDPAGASAPPASVKELQVSFFEIYMEHFYDLLPDSSPNAPLLPSNTMLRTALRLREDLTGNVWVKDVAVHTVTSVAQALRWMSVAKKNRITCTNNLNQTSSRSHFVCQLTVVDKSTSESSTMSEADGEPRLSPPAHFWVVDLAGTERGKRTKAAPGRGGVSVQEASMINSSNMALMHCIMALRRQVDAASSSSNGGHGHDQPYKVPPYRNSQLTRLLMPHWTGAGSRTSTAMIVNVNPAASDYVESKHVLKYAKSAATIQLPALDSNSDAMGDTKKPAAAKAAPMVQYDENGRRVLVRAAAAAAAKKADGSRNSKASKDVGGTSMRDKVGKLLRKLSPMRGGGGGAGATSRHHPPLKRKQAGDADTTAAAAVQVSTKSATSHPAAAVPSHPSKRLKSEGSGAAAKAAPSTHSERPLTPFPALKSATKTATARGSAKKLPPTSTARAPNTVAVKQSVAYKKLMTELAVAKTNNELLAEQNQMLLDKIKEMENAAYDKECEIRSEVLNDIGKRLTQQRNDYEERISQLHQQYKQQQNQGGAVDVLSTAMKANNAKRVADLEDQLQEYEHDNQALREAVFEDQDRISELHVECARLKDEIVKKNAIIKTYRGLLEAEEQAENDDDDEVVLQDDDDDDDEMEEESEEEEDEEDRRPTLLTEPTEAAADGSSDSGSEVGAEDDDESRRATLVSAYPGADPDLPSPAESPMDEVHDASTVDGATGDSKVAAAEHVDASTDDAEDAGIQGLEEATSKTSPSVSASTAKLSRASNGAGNENSRSLFGTAMSPKRPNGGSTMKSPKPTSDRKPLGTLGTNLGVADPGSDDEAESEEEEDQLAELWLEPKVKAKIDPKTGMYKRPKGRKPAGVEDWDATKGKWRLSIT